MAKVKTVAHTAFFPIFSQAGADGRGTTFKADATPENAAAIVEHLAMALGRLGGFTATDIFEVFNVRTEPKSKAKTTAIKPKIDAESAFAFEKGGLARYREDDELYNVRILRLLKNNRADIEFLDVEGDPIIVDRGELSPPRAKRAR